MTREIWEARKTVLLVAGAFALISVWRYYRGRAMVAIIFAVIAASLLLLAGVAPDYSMQFHRGWMRLGKTLGHVNSRILLCLVYFGVLAPLGFIMRLFGRNPLDRRGKQRASYWVPRPTPRQTREDFERLF